MGEKRGSGHKSQRIKITDHKSQGFKNGQSQGTKVEVGSEITNIENCQSKRTNFPFSLAFFWHHICSVYNRPIYETKHTRK